MQPSIFIDDDAPPANDTRRPTWTLRHLVMGLALLAIIRAIGWIPRGSVMAIPFWLRMTLGALLPQLLLLAFPLILARCSGNAGRFHWPDLTKFVIEAALAIPVIIGMLILMVIVGYVLSRVSPHTSLTPAAFEEAAQTHNVSFVVTIVLLAVAVAPVCEEVFFRGFLHNALRTRMPVVLAAVIQSLIFAVVHTFGAPHSIAVFFIGLILTAVYAWRQSLLAPIFVHTGVNLISSLSLVAMLLSSANSPVLGVFGHDHREGCQVDQVVPDTGAAKAGIAPGDVMTKFDGQPIASFSDLSATVRQHKVGDEVTIELTRKGEHVSIEVVLGQRP
jgi:membrane protease YdiL (CAAX protease family)